MTQNYEMTSSEKEIFLYGLRAMTEMGISIFICCVIMFITRHYLEGVIFFAMFIPLRSFAGGFHCEKTWVCMITSSLSFLAILLLSDINLFYPNISYLISIFCIVLIVLISPVINDSRPVMESEYPVFAKRLAIHLLCILGIETLLLYLNLPHYVWFMSIILIFMVIILLAGKLKWNHLNYKNSYLRRWIRSKTKQTSVKNNKLK